MASVNKVILVGNCGRDPEIRYLPSGQAVANVSVATSSKRKDKNTGETSRTRSGTASPSIDRLAEIAGEYVKKGRPIYVEGRLKYGKYTDKDGVEKNTCDIIATEMQLLGGREGMGGPSGGDEEGGGARRARPGARARRAGRASGRPRPSRRPASTTWTTIFRSSQPAPQITPPPRHTSPSYSTADWPGRHRPLRLAEVEVERAPALLATACTAHRPAGSASWRRSAPGAGAAPGHPARIVGVQRRRLQPGMVVALHHPQRVASPCPCAPRTTARARRRRAARPSP